MKIHLLYFLLFALALGSCKKNKTEPFMGNPDERLSAQLNEYQSQLMGAEFGWKAYLLTDSKQRTNIDVATFLFSFKDNKVTMSADYVKDNKEQQQESSYRLKALQRPTLIFDTYSILHKITDPAPSVFDGDAGKGHYADFEFTFISTNADTIKLEGTLYKNKLYLIRSKSAADNSVAFSAKKDINNNIILKLKTYFRRATINGTDYDLYIDPIKNNVDFKYLDDTGAQKTISAKCFVTGTSLNFFEPVTIGNKTLIGIKDLSFDASSNLIKATTSYGEPFQIKEANAPVCYDDTKATKFVENPLHQGYYNPNYKWSESYTGFTIDNRVDAYGVKTIDGFSEIEYCPKLPFANTGALILRAFSSESYEEYEYGIRVISTVKNGKVFFKHAGSPYEIPSEAIKPIIDNTMNSFLIEEGFYVIQTSKKNYILVEAKDARKWITFE